MPLFTFGDYTYSVKGINWGSSLPKKPQQPRALILGSSHILFGLSECGRCRKSLFPETELSFSLSWIETHFHQASRLNKSLAVCSLKDVWVLSGPRFLQIKLLKDLCSALCVNVSLLFSWMNSQASKAGSCVGCFSFYRSCQIVSQSRVPLCTPTHSVWGIQALHALAGMWWYCPGSGVLVSDNVIMVAILLLASANYLFPSPLMSSWILMAEVTFYLG